jgi:hypothetical protein
MATDSFTDTAGVSLTSHAPDAGGTWTVVGGLPAPVITDANRVRCGSSNASTVLSYHSFAAGSADYPVGADIVRRSSTGTNGAGVLGRYDSGADSGYFLRISGTSLALWRRVAGANTSIATASFTPTIDVPFRMELVMAGSTIVGKIDGATLINYSDGTPVTGAGKAGIVIFSSTAPANNAGFHVDNFDGFSLGGIVGPLIGGQLIGGRLSRGRLLRA